MSTQDLRFEFVVEADREGANVRRLCRRFGISAKTGYKWLERFRTAGKSGLADRGRRPLTCPRRSDPQIEAAVLAVREQHPAWGGRKLRRVLENQSLAAPPAPSTITAILRRRGAPVGQFGGGAAPFKRFEHDAPNDLWQMDFKGHVVLGDGSRLHPLTVLDDHSRFALVLKACANERTDTVKAALVEAFRRYGLPKTLISDNGPPWGDRPDAPFTPLGVFLIDQGVRISHSRPYHPQTMGKDERFHRTLKAEALAGPPFADLTEAARRLESWRHVYNHDRPHQALGLTPPAQRYQASPRDYCEAVPAFDYAPDDRMRKVQNNGAISFEGRPLRLPRAFIGLFVALRPTARDGLYQVYYRHQLIAVLDLKAKNGDPQPVTYVSEQALPISPV